MFAGYCSKSDLAMRSYDADEVKLWALVRRMIDRSIDREKS